MLRYAEHRMASAGTDPWSAADDGWQRDEALAQALREELVARCGDPAASDPATGEASAEDLLLLVEMCSERPRARDQVRAGVDALVSRGLLVRTGEGTGDHLAVSRSGIVRILRAGAEQQLTGMLARLMLTPNGQEADHVGAPDEPPAPVSWTPWQRKRFATVPALARPTAEERSGAHGDELATLPAEPRPSRTPRTPRCWPEPRSRRPPNWRRCFSHWPRSAATSTQARCWTYAARPRCP
ncbi:hypothetical protein [Streptomyces sp. NPDC092952]|uniref:hypothetical protein n=1 Tax=Streptomyces sp. NPDC092952 TaxID=3366018 RepID=UPI003807BF92